MGLWSKEKVDPQDLNNGYEWTVDDQVAVEELNAMTNCSLYAQDFVEKLVTNIDVSEAGFVGTPSVTLVDGDGATNGKPYKKFKFANLKGEKGDAGGVAPVVQDTGTATDRVMSQNAVTTELESRAKSDASNLTNEDVASWANKFFPVGSIYISKSDSENPASFMGGTWRQIRTNVALPLGDYADVDSLSTTHSVSYVAYKTNVKGQNIGIDSSGVMFSVDGLPSGSGYAVPVFTNLYAKLSTATNVLCVDIWEREA